LHRISSNPFLPAATRRASQGRIDHDEYRLLAMTIVRGALLEAMFV
jgi:hypothetical protein